MPRSKKPTKVAVAKRTSRVSVQERKRPLMLTDLIPGDDKSAIREKIKRDGFANTNVPNKLVHMVTRPVAGTDDHEVLAVAAVSRDPGRTQAYIDAIQDFIPTTGKSKDQEVNQLWQIYKTEGLINNGINKVAAILSSGGRYSVKSAKKGKVRKAAEQLQAVLDEFLKNVNNSPEDAVVTGSRGIKALVQQATRQCLVEGDWFGRTIWTSHEVRGLGSFDMPMTIQSITSAQIEPIKETAGMGMEEFYWKPPQSVLQQIQKPTNKDVADSIKRFIQDKDLLNQLKKNKKARLDPALLLHIKHRGVDTEAFGNSFISPALNGIAFKRSVEALDFVSMESLINRLSIVQVGAGGKDSAYSDPLYAAGRAQLMQSFFDDPGPNMTIVWQGDDIKVIDVGAHEKLIESDNRHKVAEGKVKAAMGLPEALLSGTTADGKAAGWAATIGAAAELEELQNGFTNALSTLGQRIATENGFEDVEIEFSFNNSIMADKSEEWNQGRNDRIIGMNSIRTYLSMRGLDPQAEYEQACFEKGLTPGEATWEEAFIAPQGLQGQGPGKVPGNGAPAGNPDGKTQQAPTEKKKPTENK